MTVISVVIPAYNASDHISRAVESALSQTVSDVEIIVVDDASTDNTVEILDQYSGSIKILQHEKNRGGSMARNTGIRHASGKYIALLDADDEWDHHKLESQLEFLEGHDSNWVGTYCDFRQMRKNDFVERIDNLIRRPTGYTDTEEIIKRIFLRRFAHGGSSTLFIRRNVLNQIGGFDSTFRRHQDLELLIRILKKGKIGYVDEVLVYKYDTGGASAELTEEAFTQFITKFEDEIADRGLKNTMQKNHRFTMAKKHFSRGRFSKGIRFLCGSKPSHHRDVLGLGLSILRGFIK